MKARRGAIRGLCLGMVAAGLTAGLGTVSAPAAQGALPGPDSGSWIAVKKSGVVATDPTNDFSTSYLNLTPSGGTLANSTAFVAADLDKAYFRFHVAELPAADAVGGYVVQFDTNSSTAGWERALRYSPATRTVTLFSSADNSGVTAPGTGGATVPSTQTEGTSYAGANGGAFVAFAVPRARLTDVGIVLGAPMVMGATIDDGVGIDAEGFLGLNNKGDILGVAKSNPGWGSAALDPLDFDIDGDGVVDRLDNCPVNGNPLQEDDDEAVDNSLPPGTIGQPDGTEGKGNACDRTPRGYDLDEDDVGSLDDQCPERPGLLANGCVAQSTTTAILRYRPRGKVFMGQVRADYDVCIPRRTVTVYKFVAGPDRNLGTVKTDSTGHYSLAKKATRGKYYVQVDTKLIFDQGARCFAVKSPKIEVR